VVEKIAQQLSSYTCLEPEEQVKQAAGVALAAALEAQDPAGCVRVSAGGHQAPVYDEKGQPTGRYQNNLQITVEPIQGFVQ
jgi:hypothetical protein